MEKWHGETYVSQYCTGPRAAPQIVEVLICEHSCECLVRTRGYIREK